MGANEKDITGLFEPFGEGDTATAFLPDDLEYLLRIANGPPSKERRWLAGNLKDFPPSSERERLLRALAAVPPRQPVK